MSQRKEKREKRARFTRREFITNSLTGAAGVIVGSSLGASIVKAQKPTPKREIINGSIRSCPFGSDIYVMGGALASVINKRHPWIRLSNVETLGGVDDITSTENLSSEEKKYIILDVSAPSYWMAREGKPPYKHKYPDVKVMMAFAFNATFFMTLDPKIKTPQDLIGKKMATGPKNVGNALVCANIMKHCWGILDKVHLKPMAYTEFKDAMFDGLVDAAISSAAKVEEGFDLTKWDPIRQARQLYYIGISKKDLPIINEAMGTPMGYELIPPHTKGLDNVEPFGGLMVGYCEWHVWKEADEEFVYEVVKTIAENIGDFKAYHAGIGGAMAKEGPSILSRVSIRDESDVHPGALKYYKKAGLKVGY